MPGLGIDRRFVADAQLDRIEPTGDRQLVHRRLEREHPWALAWRAHPRVRWDVEPREPVRGAAVRRGVHYARRDGGGVDGLVNGRGLLGDGGFHRPEPAVPLRPPPNSLDCTRAVVAAPGP